MALELLSLLCRFSKILQNASEHRSIEDCAKDGGEEFFTEMHCFL